MTTGIPVEVIERVEAAILSAFEHDELWRATRPMGDLHDHVTHASLKAEVTELVTWAGKRNLMLELLDNMHEAVPGNLGLQTARSEYAAAEKRLLESGPPPAPAFAETASDQATGTGDGGSKNPAPPWAWMAVGALVLVVIAVVFFGGEDDGPDSTDPNNFIGGVTAFDACASGDLDACDVLFDECAAGVNLACDDLFDATPDGSEYSIFGDTCGGRLPAGPAQSCFDDLGP